MNYLCVKRPLAPECQPRLQTGLNGFSVYPAMVDQIQNQRTGTTPTTVSNRPTFTQGQLPTQFYKQPEDTRASENLVKLFNKLKTSEISKLNLGVETKTESADQHLYARLSDVAYSHGYKQSNRTIELLKKTDYELLPEFSTRNWAVLRNRVTKEVVMSFRGSDTKFADIKTVLADPARALNVEDWWVNMHTAIGRPELTRRYADAVRAVERVSTTLNIEPKDIIFTGHSKGGALGRRMAEIFNAKAFVFNPADTPVKDMTFPGSGEKGDVTVYRTYGDLVSLGVERGQTPEHLKIVRMTAKPGTETDLIKQHDLSQFYNEGGELETPRTSKLRNFLGTTSSTVASGLFGLGTAELFQPVYKNQGQEAFNQGLLFGDTAKTLALEGLLDPGGTVVDLIDTMGMGLLPQEKEHIRHALGLRPAPPAQSTPPPFITALQKLSDRYKQDQLVKALQEGTPVAEDAHIQAMLDRNKAQEELVRTQDVATPDGGFIRDGKKYYPN